jgi:hypothetical protein
MFSADFAKVLNALQVIHEKLVSTRNTYQATEDANTARVNQVAGLTGGGAATGTGAAKGGTLSGTDGKGEANIAPNAPAATGAGGGLSGVGGLAQSLGRPWARGAAA